MAQYKLPLPESSEKLLTVLCGDVSKQNFALSQLEYDSLRSQITQIYHTAANTNFLLDYSFGARENFLSTCEVLRFTFCTRPPKYLLYISTLSVFGSRITSGDSLSEDDSNADIGCVLHSDGYSQSKWLSEQILFSAARKQPRASSFVSIVRLGLIGFSSVSGIGNSRDWFSMLFRSMIQSRSRPHLPLARFNLLPVDLAAYALSVIGKATMKEEEEEEDQGAKRERSSSEISLRVYHLSHTHEISFDAIAQQWFAPFEKISPSFSEWLRDVTQRSDDILLPLASFLQGGLPPPGRIRQSRTLELLREKRTTQKEEEDLLPAISVESGKLYAKFLQNLQ